MDLGALPQLNTHHASYVYCLTGDCFPQVIPTQRASEREEPPRDTIAPPPLIPHCVRFRKLHGALAGCFLDGSPLVTSRWGLGWILP